MPLPGVVPPLAARIPFAAIPALLLAVSVYIISKLALETQRLREESAKPTTRQLLACASTFVLYVAGSALLASVRPFGVSWLLLWRASAALAAFAAAFTALSMILAVGRAPLHIRKILVSVACILLCANAALNLAHVRYAL